MSISKTFWQRLKAMGLPLVGLIFVAGILCWGAFNTVLEWTNTESFCLACHEMKDNVFKEYRNTIHYSNRTGVRATCPDCHVPRDWTSKLLRKIQASNELFHHLLGTVSTPEKFNAKRPELARSEWARMKKSDSRECRNCHNFDYMDYSEQGRRASAMHQKGFDDGMTCIDCHRGIAHTMPPVEQGIGAEKGGVSIAPDSN
ncbi:MAG: NapC/NirT family cytochrome c [Zoogloeaceae bacterium]|jgi:cytochrome c-type protein NapC|nr:NapC/NirT family cytochrome c [Zoogloeaceae bacterium]